MDLARRYYVTIILVLIQLTIHYFHFTLGDSTKVCKVHDSRGTDGICKPLTDCPQVIGLLRAGVLPTRCSLQGPSMICCPSKTRISTEKCKSFMKILRQPIKPKQALSFDGGLDAQDEETKDVENNKIDCESFSKLFISGGVNASLREYPYQVALGYGEKPDWRCGGVLIDPSFAITAGHCLLTEYGPPTVVLLGDRKLSSRHDSTRKVVKVSQLHIHPKYRPPLQYNDIAIIKLEKPVTLSRGVLPVCLPNPVDRLDRAVNVQASGWGSTGAFDGQSDMLKGVTLAKFDTAECSKVFKENSGNEARLPHGIIPSQFCAGDKYGLRDTCKGDSGGPVTVEDVDFPCIRYLLGITSFGAQLCGYQQPGVYTNILSYLDFIEDIVWNNSTLIDESKSQASPKVDNSNQQTTTTTKRPNPITTTQSSSVETKQVTTTFPTPLFMNAAPKIENSKPMNKSVPSEPAKHPVSPTVNPNLEKNKGFGSFFNLNISSTVAALLNKFSIGR